MVSWICCQLGAREHYAIPRAVYGLGTLDLLITDAWVPPTSILRIVGEPRSEIRDRWHEELKGASVTSFNWSLIAFEVLSRAHGLNGWSKILARNQWFQRKVVGALTSLAAGAAAKAAYFRPLTSDAPVLLSYSYTALEPFRYAKANGWKTMLVQIDPGPEEERIVAEEAARVPHLAADWQAARPEYWTFWREECKLADRIVVNSDWAREGLIRGGVPNEKIAVIPLAYEVTGLPDHETTRPQDREYPVRFTFERPLRVLFLGLINLRKGVARLLEAARILRDEPVEFWMVGPVEIANAGTITDTRRVKWFGAVPRNNATEFYRDADVFILPTLSDGFAITQLEAQAHGLPVIASKNCGKVVENGVNGIILDEPSAACIAHTVRDFIASPDRLEKLAYASGVHHEFTIEALGQRLQHLGATL